MLNQKNFNKNNVYTSTQRFAFLFFLLFALAPCKVKASFLQSFNIEFSKPLNKNKIAKVSSASCDAQILDFHKTHEVKQNNNVKFFVSPDFCFSTTEINHKVSLPEKKAILTSGNSPPFYVLYKRFKFDLV